MKNASSECAPESQACFPAVILGEYDSPIDALLGLRVSMDEAMNQVAAAWSDGRKHGVMAHIDGQRVAAILLANGRWAACKVFEPPCATPREAEQRLAKLLKRGRRGMIVSHDKRGWWLFAGTSLFPNSSPDVAHGGRERAYSLTG